MKVLSQIFSHKLRRQ